MDITKEQLVPALHKEVIPDAAPDATPDAISEMISEATPEAADGVGERLRRARARAKLEIANVAAELHLTHATVIALEHENYTGLPSPVFVTGYIRSYARLVGLDPEPLLALYRGTHDEPPPETPPVRSKSALGGRLAMVLTTLLVLLALAGGVLAWWINGDGTPFNEMFWRRLTTPSVWFEGRPRTVIEIEDSASAVGEAADARSTVDPLVRQTPPVTASEEGSLTASRDAPDRPDEAAGTAPDRAAPPNSDVDTAPSLEPEAGAEAGAETEAETEPPPAIPDDGEIGGETLIAANANPATATVPTEVVLSFSAPCWVDIRDASGTFRLVGEMSRGTRRTLGGQPPYSMIIGNATAVEIQVGGRVLDIRRFARGNVARFDLDPARLSGE